MDKPKRRFASGFAMGFVAASLLVGAGAVLAVGEIYTPATNWIQNALKYAPGSNDQVNVLADLQQGAAEVMFDVGLRLNVLNSAGKKQNWDLVTHEAEEIEESFDRLMITRPDLSTDLENFITSRIDPLVAVASAPAPDKAAFKTALGTLVASCTGCHQLYGEDAFVVKLGKSALPLQ